MTSDFAHVAKRLLGELPPDATSAHVADRAVDAYAQLSSHMARLLGEAGIRVLLKRSILLASARFPWLAGVSRSENASALRDALVLQDPVAVTDAFVAILFGFVGLLEKLIGEPLVKRLIDEVWPGIFAQAAKDTP